MLQVATGKAGQSNELLEAMARGREDRQFFSQVFLNRTLHDGQLEWVENAEATVNCLATSNRWGKTTVLVNGHVHPCVYKTGAEHRYLDENGAIDLEKFLRLKYHTIHTADGWDTTALVWEDLNKIHAESEYLRALVSANPKSMYPYYDFINGSKCKFKTLGDSAQGIDGNSFYRVSIDEAGWVDRLEEKMTNVIRVRIADVQGSIWLAGTFKPGISKDFYKYCVRASAATGRGLGFDHRSDVDDAASVDAESLDSSIRKYLREFGIDLDEYADAIGGR